LQGAVTVKEALATALQLTISGLRLAGKTHFAYILDLFAT
jgi:hypothetical protein